MPLHPAAPEDLAGLVDAYAQTVRAVIDLGHSCSDADFNKDTACPGWTVKDQISHVVGVEEWVGGAPLPRIPIPDYGHLRSDADRATELHVEARRSMLGKKVVTELETVLAQRLRALTDPGLSLDSIVKSTAGPAPVRIALRARILDIWTHEQDMRQALGRPGNLDAPGASIFLEQLFDALPRLVARNAGIEPGNVVIIDVTGPVVGRAGVRVEAGEGGKNLGTPLFSGIAHEGLDEHSTSIALSPG
jgi:uncharacterized protein (TIGR03083 family)